MTHYHVVFTGPPGPEDCQFVEVEDGQGRSVCAGRWYTRESNGVLEWVLELPIKCACEPPPSRL